jgi:tetratricopeptide (TPR) repeat protein
MVSDDSQGGYMEEKAYWGKEGEYGPFTPQKDGWPNAGEVVRHYRLAKQLSYSELALLYQQETGDTATRQWMSLMEHKNRVPVDITRRQALVRILEIPPILLGLGSLNEILPKEAPPASSGGSSGPTVLKRQTVATDLEIYETSIRSNWQLHHTSQAHNALGDIQATTQQLESLEKAQLGKLQPQIRELLLSHYLLTSRVHYDLLNLPAAYNSANQAVSVAKRLERPELIALALYERGYALGTQMGLGIGETDPKRLNQALRNFEQALPLASKQLKGRLQLEISRLQSLLKSSVSDITAALKVLDMAEKGVKITSKSDIDPHTLILLEGTNKRFHEQNYLLGRAITLNAAGCFDKALEVFEDLELLDIKRKERKDYTRHYAWLDSIEAQSYIGIKDYQTATLKATDALIVFKDIDSVENIAIIKSISDALLKSPYRRNKEAIELERMLSKYYQERRARAE